MFDDFDWGNGGNGGNGGDSSGKWLFSRDRSTRLILSWLDIVYYPLVVGIFHLFLVYLTQEDVLPWHWEMTLFFGCIGFIPYAVIVTIVRRPPKIDFKSHLHIFSWKNLIFFLLFLGVYHLGLLVLMLDFTDLLAPWPMTLITGPILFVFGILLYINFYDK